MSAAISSNPMGYTGPIRSAKLSTGVTEIMTRFVCKTWLEAQITLINLEQAKLEEVFLPYLIMPGHKTLFETMEHNQFLLPEKHAA
jgi:hypothetical protein